MFNHLQLLSPLTLTQCSGEQCLFNMHLKNRRALETFIQKYLHLAACRHSSTPPPSSSPQSTNKQRTMRVHRRISPYSHSDVSSLLIFYLCLDYNQLSASYRRCASPLSSSSSSLALLKAPHLLPKVRESSDAVVISGKWSSESGRCSAALILVICTCYQI